MVGHVRLVGKVGAGYEREELLAQLGAVGGARERAGGIRLQGINPGRVGHRTLIHGPVNGYGARIDVYDFFATVVNHEPTRAGYLAENAGLHVPLGNDRQKSVELVGPHHGHHALLALRHENFFGRQRGIAQKNVVELHEHAAVAVAGELARGTRNARRTQILDALDESASIELKTALDEHLLGKRVAHLHRGTLCGAG